MRWIYELSWLWKSIGILILIVAICEWCAALIYKGMKKHYGVMEEDYGESRQSQI